MSTSDQLRTYTEMAVADEFVQEGEKLESGSLVADVGLNRIFERLARNTDALLDALQTSRNMVIVGGGDMAWAKPNFTRTANITIRMLNEIGTATNNVILSAAGISLAAADGVCYVKLDRETDAAALTPTYAATMAAFLAVVTADADRADYQLLAYRNGNDLILWDGRRVLDGESLTGNGFTDTQYGQQTELTTVHDNQRENLNIILTGGGWLTWDVATETLTWDDEFLLTFPMSAGDNNIAAGSQVIESGRFWYAVLQRSPGSSLGATESTVADGSVPAADTSCILAYHNPNDGRLYLRDGSSLGDGDRRRLGGFSAGVDFFYATYGNGTQVYDLTEGGTYPDRTYKVGDGSLMVYLNGVKCKVSDAVYTGADINGGSLSEALDDGDRVVQWDDGDTFGYRLIFLADDQAAAEVPYHAAGTHTIPWAWPSSTDWIEAFVGLQGEGPSPVESVGAMDSGGTPIAGDVLLGDLFLKEGTGVTLTYDAPNNAIVVTVSATAGVVSLEATGGGEGAQSGVLTLTGGTNITLSDSAGDITITCDIENLADLADVSANLSAAITGAESPSATNPLVTAAQAPRISGFGIIRTSSGTEINLGYGRILIDGESYIADNSTGALTAGITDIIEGGGASDSTWYYLYVTKHASNPGEMQAEISSASPIDGMHPTEDDYIFVSSVYVDAATLFTSFQKVGDKVMVNGQSLSLSSPTTVGRGAAEAVSYTVGDEIPDSGVSSIEVLFSWIADSNGDLEIQFGPSTVTYLVHQFNVVADRYYTLRTPIMMSSGTDWHYRVTDTGSGEEGDLRTLNGVWLVGYSEGRYSTDNGMWS